MELKFLIIFLIYMTVSLVVESKPIDKLNVKDDKISELKTGDASQNSREKRQINYIYYPYQGYQSYYVNSIQRPTKQPQRRSTTTQRYSIWQLSRKRRSAVANEIGDSELSQQKYSNQIRNKRQIDDLDDGSDYYPYDLPLLFGRRQNYGERRNQPYSMWDLTRRKRNVVEKINNTKL